MADSPRKQLSDAIDAFWTARAESLRAIDETLAGDEDELDEDDEEIEDALIEGPLQNLDAATIQFNQALNGRAIRFRRERQEWVAVPGKNGSVDVHPIDEHVW